MKPTLSRLIVGVATAALLSMPHPALAQAAPSITDLSVIPLKQGVNTVNHMALDGRDGQIVEAWRVKDNAQGYNLYLIMLEGKLVGVGENDGFKDVIADYPHNTSDAARSVRFAWGSVGGHREMLLITATRDIQPDAGVADPAETVIDFYQLAPNGGVGTTGDAFVRINETHTPKKYCNSDLALSKSLGLPLPHPFQGANQDDGCL